MRRRQRAANEKGKNMTAEIMDAAKAGMEKALSNLNEAFVNVRTGRANPMVLDKIRVDYYGVPTPINQMAAVKSPDAHMLVVEPWDKSVLRGIEAAILTWALRPLTTALSFACRSPRLPRSAARKW